MNTLLLTGTIIFILVITVANFNLLMTHNKVLKDFIDAIIEMQEEEDGGEK